MCVSLFLLSSHELWHYTVSISLPQDICLSQALNEINLDLTRFNQMRNPPSDRPHEGKGSDAFSSVSWQQDDPVLLMEQGRGCPLVGKHSQKCSHVDRCFGSPSTFRSNEGSLGSTGSDYNWLTQRGHETLIWQHHSEVVWIGHQSLRCFRWKK